MFFWSCSKLLIYNTTVKNRFFQQEYSFLWQDETVAHQTREYRMSHRMAWVKKTSKII